MNLIRETSFRSLYTARVAGLRFLRQGVLPAIVLDVGTPYFYVSTLDGREGFTVIMIIDESAETVSRDPTWEIPGEYIP